MRGPDFMELRAFELVARYRSFSRAADKLEMSRSALSLLVKNLEQRIGVQLLNRTTRSVAPTEAGQVFLQSLSPALLELVSVVDDISEFRDRPAGTVRILSSPLGAELCLQPHLKTLADEFPEIRLELCVGDSSVDLVSEGFDAAIRADGSIEKDLNALKLSNGHDRILVAAPDYLAQHGRPAEIRDLAQHRCIVVRQQGQGDNASWRLSAGGDVQSVSIGNGLRVNDHRVALNSAIDGLGIGLMIDELAAPAIERGELEVVLKSWGARLPGFFLCYPRPLRVSRAFDSFRDFLKSARHSRIHAN